MAKDPPAPLPPAVVELLAADPRIERCPPDGDYAESVLERVLAEEVEDALHAAAQDRWAKASTYSYDGARKCVEAWLLSTGWRVRATAGARAAVGEIVARWLADADAPGPRIAKTFAAARKARHDDEYPSCARVGQRPAHQPGQGAVRTRGGRRDRSHRAGLAARPER
jgi:hypothetical protein